MRYFEDFVVGKVTELGSRVMVEDRALSEAMDQRPELCGSAADKVDMLSVCVALILLFSPPAQLSQPVS